MSTWDKTNNSFGHSLTALDTTKKKSGRYSGRIDDNYPANWEKYVYSDTWTPINNSQDTYYTVSGWVYVEDVTTNGSLPNLAKLWIVTRKQGERGYPTGHISTSSTKEGTWEYLSKTVLIPADVKEINVRIENARLGKVWFDDVKIVKGNTSQTVIVEESNYYPFGLKHKGYNNVVSSNGNSTAQKWKFQKQELTEDLGYNIYEYRYRHYDASIGRFISIDPLADTYVYNSTYAFQENKLGLGTEVEGKELQLHDWLVREGTTYAAKELDKKMDGVGMKKTEKSVASKNLYKMYQLQKSGNKGKAEKFAENSGLGGLRDGKGDALRHSLFNALNTQTVGKKVTKELGDAHEEDRSPDPEAKKMDLHNNGVGRKVGEDNPDASIMDIASKLLDKMENGEMITLDSKGNVTKSTLSKTDKAKILKNLQKLNKNGLTPKQQAKEDKKYN